MTIPGLVKRFRLVSPEDDLQPDPDGTGKLFYRDDHPTDGPGWVLNYVYGDDDFGSVFLGDTPSAMDEAKRWLDENG